MNENVPKKIYEAKVKRADLFQKVYDQIAKYSKTVHEKIGVPKLLGAKRN